MRAMRQLARLLHLDQIVAVAVPGLEQEAARGLVRARRDVRGDLMSAGIGRRNCCCGRESMLLWMSREPEPLLCGLAGGAQHGPDGGPGDVVLAGAKDGRGELFGGRVELVVGVGEQAEGVGFSDG